MSTASGTAHPPFQVGVESLVTYMGGQVWCGGSRGDALDALIPSRHLHALVPFHFIGIFWVPHPVDPSGSVVVLQERPLRLHEVLSKALLPAFQMG